MDLSNSEELASLYRDHAETLKCLIRRNLINKEHIEILIQSWIHCAEILEKKDNDHTD